jgi:hypothetical protein
MPIKKKKSIRDSNSHFETDIGFCAPGGDTKPNIEGGASSAYTPQKYDLFRTVKQCKPGAVALEERCQWLGFWVGNRLQSNKTEHCLLRV